MSLMSEHKQIEKRAMADIMQSNIELREIAQRGQIEIQRLSDELHAVSAERDSFAIELEMIRVTLGDLRRWVESEKGAGT